MEWFHSYLSNRTQVVNINYTISDVERVTCGVPQGSILGPLLFLCYINDMVSSISDNCKLMLYADDSAFFFLIETPILLLINYGKNWSPVVSG